MCLPNFHSRLIIEKYLTYQTSSVLSSVYYEHVLNSVDRRALAKVLSFYGVPAKGIIVISPMYWNNNASVKTGNDFSSRLYIKSGVKQGRVIPLLYGVILTDFMG